MSKKPFKSTKVGKLVGKLAPNILGIAGDLLPDAGVLGMVKNLIDKDETISLEDKQQVHSQIKELYELEVADRDSARKREIELAKAGKEDYMHSFTGIVGLLSFCFMIYAVVYLEVPENNKEVFINILGISQGIVLSIFGFYYGSAVKGNKWEKKQVYIYTKVIPENAKAYIPRQKVVK